MLTNGVLAPGTPMTSYPISFSGGDVQTPDLSSLASGSYGGMVTVSDASAGQSSCDVSVTVTDGTLSFALTPAPYTVLNVPWTGTIATFTDSDPYALLTDFSSSAGTITADGSGGFTVTGTTTYTSLTGNSGQAVTITGQGGAQGSNVGESPTVVPGTITLTADYNPLYLLPFESFSGEIATLADSRGGDTDLSDLSGMLTISGGGNSAPVSVSISSGYSGTWSIASTFGGFAPGTYNGHLTVSYSGNGASGSSSASVDFSIIVGYVIPEQPVEGTLYTTVIALTGGDPEAGTPVLESVTSTPTPTSPATWLRTCSATTTPSSAARFLRKGLMKST